MADDRAEEPMQVKNQRVSVPAPPDGVEAEVQLIVTLNKAYGRASRTSINSAALSKVA